MCATKKQTAANRRNAQKSTGPQTDQGKAISSQNHLKHGLYSGNIIVNSSHLKEDRAEFDALLEGLTSELHPDGLLQNLLVQKIAECFWRRRRLISAETANINNRINGLDTTLAAADAIMQLGRNHSNPDSPPYKPPKGNLAMDDLVMIRSIPEDSHSLYLLRYEMRLDRQLMNSLRLLTKLQEQAAHRNNTLVDPEKTRNEHSNPTAGPEQGRSGLHDEIEGIPPNPNNNNQLCENQELGQSGDSIEVAPRHPAPRRKTKNDDSNPNPPNPNDSIELGGNPDIYDPPASGHTPTSSAQDPTQPESSPLACDGRAGREGQSEKMEFGEDTPSPSGFIPVSSRRNDTQSYEEKGGRTPPP